MNYRKINSLIEKDHFPMSVIDQMHDSLGGMVEANIMTYTTTKNLGPIYSSSNIRFQKVNASLTLIYVIAQAVIIILGKWKGKSNMHIKDFSCILMN